METTCAIIELEIPGKPFADARPRFGKYGNVYDPNSAKKRGVVASIFQMCPKTPLNGPLSIYLEFGLPIPKSWNKSDQMAAKSGLKKPASRPDLDNYVKFALDCFNGLLYLDDSQITLLTATKAYSTNPSTFVRLSVLDEVSESCHHQRVL